MLNGAAPSFDLGSGGVVLVLARAWAVTGLVAGFGALLIRVSAMPRACATAATRDADAMAFVLRKYGRAVAAATLIGTFAWLLLQTADMADAPDGWATLNALAAVLTTTLFGRVLVAQMGLVAASALTAGRWPRAALCCSGLALGLQAGHGHAYAMPGAVVSVASEVVHLLAAGAWLGALPPLWLIVARAPVRLAAGVCRYFTPVGKLAVAAIALSAAWQFWVMVGDLPGTIGTAYGLVIVLKGLLLGVLVGFALANRYRFAPALLAGNPVGARRRLLLSLGTQSAVGLSALVAAAVLSQLPPAMHVQAVWPFTWQPSLVTLSEDPDFRREAIEGLAALGGAVVIAVGSAALAWRRRWPAAIGGCAVAAMVAAAAMPHLDLLFVAATPDSFYRSPTGFSAASIVAGAALYPANCAACHGALGRGDGAAASGLAMPTADLTAAHLWAHSDGELFGWLAHGIPGPLDGLVMPGFADRLSDDQLWALIDFVRARNAGLARAASGRWPVPVRAPDFGVRCEGSRAGRLSELNGAVLLVVVTALGVRVTTGSDGPRCMSDDQQALAAYSLVSGARADGLQFLVDASGWLRAVATSGTWDDASALQAEARIIDAAPLAADSGEMHHH